MIENRRYRSRIENAYDDGNIPKVDLPRERNESNSNKYDQGKNKNLTTEIELPGRMRATDIIPDEVPGRSGPGGD